MSNGYIPEGGVSLWTAARMAVRKGHGARAFEVLDAIATVEALRAALADAQAEINTLLEEQSAEIVDATRAAKHVARRALLDEMKGGGK